MSSVSDPIRRSKEPQYKRKPRDCIVPGCHAKMLIRLDNHLVAVHKLKRGSPRIKYDDVEEKPAKMSIDESYSVFDRAGQHLLLLAGGGASAKKTVYNHVLQMKKISEMAGGVKELFSNSTRLRNCHFLTQHAGTLVRQERFGDKMHPGPISEVLAGITYGDARRTQPIDLNAQVYAKSKGIIQRE